MGPLNWPPYWFILISGLGVPWAFAKNSFEFRLVLRKNSNSVPWNALLPPRVATLMLAPLLRPSSAVGLLVVTLYSWTLSGVRRYRFERGLGTVDSLASIPSIVTLNARSREPLTWMPEPAAPAERCTTPGSSTSRFS